MLVIANWKMNKTVAESVDFCKKLADCQLPHDVEIAITPPFTSLHAVAETLKNSKITFGAQDCYHEDNGAFTGEVSPVMIKEFGSKWCLVGHSERRRLFFETDEIIRRKLVALLRHGINPVLCIGERLEERQSDRTTAVLSSQIMRALEGLDLGETFTIAYEPVWAIGTGIVAKPAQVEDAHSFICDLVSRLSPKTKFNILYGGSVTADNCSSLLVKNVDGFLVGGASLTVDTFFKITSACSGR
ncbi:MAG: triose-phosphate isomerase [Caldisericia bacterium]|nr:triose-phosphate isomerase [Caldisericia bacterium]